MFKNNMFKSEVIYGKVISGAYSYYYGRKWTLGKKKKLPKKLGHKAGAEALKNIIQYLINTNVKHLTVYAFSTENWKRSNEEVNDLMNLLREYILKYIKENNDSNVKIDTIGDLSVLPKDLVADILKLKEMSYSKTGLNLHIAINYGGRDEIIRAIKSMYKDISLNKLKAEDISENLFSSYLDTKDYKEPEIIIRTSGEFRLSNFLTWQSVYSELFFVEKFWPDFTYKDLEEVIYLYQKRERRFGGRS